MPIFPRLRVGDTWYEPNTGTRYRIVRLIPSRSADLPPLVEVRRLNPPRWDNGTSTWAATAFVGMLRDASTL